jgi:hypothetical protein
MSNGETIKKPKTRGVKTTSQWRTLVLHPSNQTLDCGKWSCWEWNIAQAGGSGFPIPASGSAIDCRATAAGEP